MNWIKDRALLICVSVVAAVLAYLLVLAGRESVCRFPVLVIVIYVIEHFSKNEANDVWYQNGITAVTGTVDFGIKFPWP